MQFEPHGVVGVDERPCQPGDFAGLDLVQRRMQFRQVGAEPGQLRRGRRDDRRHPLVHIIEAGQYRGVVFGVVVGVGLAVLELPVRHQGLEIGCSRQRKSL